MPNQSSIFSISATLLLTFLVSFSIFWNFQNLDEKAVKHAEGEARANWKKDAAFRSWATRHGGVYVRPNDRTPPNPYLEFLPNRDVVTKDGMKLTLMNPAYIMSQMTKEFETEYGIKGKITGQILLNPQNAPDEWELKALKQFNQGAKEVVEQIKIENQDFVRFMRPMIMEKGCVKCHGHLGFKEGDIRGGVSISIPLKGYFLSATETKNSLIKSHLGFWLFSIIAIFLFYRKAVASEVVSKISEKALLASEAKFSQAFNESPYACTITTEAGEYLDVNSAFEKYTGYKKEEAIGKTAGDLNIWSDNKFRRAFINSLRKNGRVDALPASYRRKDGVIRHTRITAQFTWIEEEKCILTFAPDVTEEVESVAALARSNNIKGAVLEGALDAIITIDLSGAVVEFNTSAQQIFGYDLDEVMGRDIGDLIIPKNKRDAHHRGIDEFNRTGTSPILGKHLEIQAQRKSGELFPAEISITHVAGHDLFTAFIKDISKQKESEEALRRSQKMDAIGQLTGGIAHDFNNILGIAMGNIELIGRLVAGNQTVEDRIEKAMKALNRASGLTKQLLGFSRKEAVAKELININDILMDVSSLIEHSVPKNIRTTVTLAEDIWETHIDAGELQDAIVNLCVNAGHAMPEGGTLEIETSNISLPNLETEINQHWVLIKLSDTGCGIPKDKIEHIFEPFFTTKEKGKGTGLGLSMVYGFVKRSKGEIKVLSEVGIGTTFHIFLPRAHGDNEVEQLHKPPIFKKSDGNETILIVDDEEDLGELASTFLKNAGYKTFVATSGLEALDLLATEPSIDLVFSDIVMPGGINGYELEVEISKKYPMIKVCLTSGFATGSRDNPSERNLMPKHLSQPILKKPYSESDLLNYTGSLLDEIVLIKWTPLLETGVPIIDEDHKFLVSLVNRANVVGNQSTKKDICSILEDLAVYIKHHFQREEALMQACSYPDLENHQKIHRALEAQVHNFINHCANDELSVDGEEISSFLKDWLYSHILEQDLPVAEYTVGKETEIRQALQT